MPDTTIFTTPYLYYAGIARPARSIDRITLDSLSFQPVSWESLSNAAATTTYTPCEFVSSLQHNEQAVVGTSSIDIEGIVDAVSRSTGALNRLNRNQRVQLEMTTNNLSEYLFDILDGRYGMNDVESVEPKAVPIPKEKLLEVLLAE